MNDNEVLYKDLSYQIVGILFDVYNDLGYGYKEKYYEQGTEQYFINQSIKYVRQASYQIVASGKVIAMNYIDFVVDNKIVLELKKGNHFSKQNMDQIKQYLQITGLKLAILANFTPNGVKFIRVLNPNNLQK